MNLGFEGKVALVTGGASGIGEASARLFAEEGAGVAILDRNRDRGEALCRDLSGQGTRSRFFPVDLTDENACRDAVAAALKEFGRIDALVNNAGVNDGISLDATPGEFMQSLQRNLFHVFAVTHFAREALKSAQGSIVNLSSKVSVTGQGATSGYAAAKGGINALTREWAVALAPHGVRVNCVVPAECDTPQYQNWFQSLPDPIGTRQAIESLIPLGGRMTTTAEMAALIVFLSSPRSGHTTGQIIFVDGGYTHLDRAFSHSHRKWS